MARVEVLKADLADIECLDRFYWQTENPERHEKQMRRRFWSIILAFPQEERQAMKRTLFIAALTLLSLFTLGNTSADRKQCCHGCGNYGCNQTNCGDKCSAGPHCSGCWKSCLK
jgi:hypothetical protein